LQPDKQIPNATCVVKSCTDDDAPQNALKRIRKVAGRDKSVKFTALLHHITVEKLGESFSALKHRASAGIDGVDWSDYKKDLQENLLRLHERVHKGSLSSVTFTEGIYTQE
jgi:hypothetical protein